MLSVRDFKRFLTVDWIGRRDMAKSKRKIQYGEHRDPSERFPDISNVASASECSGLMHRSPVDGAEWENYQELSSMAIPRDEVPQDGRSLKDREKAKPEKSED